MSASQTTPLPARGKISPFQFAFVRATMTAGGAFYTLVGLLLLFAPVWFYENVGTFPPYNRHYAGDTGTFTLAIGVMMLVAARRPFQHRGVILLAVIASWLHGFNHIYDDFVTKAGLIGPLLSSVPLLIFAIVLTVAYFMVNNQPTD